MSKVYARIVADNDATKERTRTAQRCATSHADTFATFTSAHVNADESSALRVRDKTQTSEHAREVLRVTLDASHRRARIVLRSDVALDVVRLSASSVACESRATHESITTDMHCVAALDVDTFTAAAHCVNALSDVIHAMRDDVTCAHKRDALVSVRDFLCAVYVSDAERTRIADAQREHESVTT